MKTDASKLNTKPQPRQRRSSWKVRSTQLAVSLLTLWVFRAQAVPMDYIFSGYTSGTFGGIPFNNARVTLDLYADTDNILDIQLGPGSGRTLAIVGSSATVTVDGIGTGTFTTPKCVFDTTFFSYPQDRLQDLVRLGALLRMLLTRLDCAQCPAVVRERACGR